MSRLTKMELYPSGLHVVDKPFFMKCYYFTALYATIMIVFIQKQLETPLQANWLDVGYKKV